MINNKNLKINEGTLNFWIKENSINFKDNQSVHILEVNPEGGDILCIKDSDGKLKFFFVVLGKGRVDIEFDVSTLDSSKKHMITFTWNLLEKSLNLYIDGSEVKKQTIPF